MSKDSLLKEKLLVVLICTTYVMTGKQFADILTKGVSSSVFHAILNKLDMQDIFALA
jgi:hypothetical protein